MERWADGWIGRAVRAIGGERARLVAELVATIWRDGYRCGRRDRDDELRAALGLDRVIDEPPVEPMNGAERLQRTQP